VFVYNNIEVIKMTIRDRGKMKWHGAFFMPEHVKMLGNLRTDYYRTEKPQLDLNQYEEFDERVSGAMAENLPIKVTIWQNGITSDIIGNVHYIDPLTKQLRMEVNSGVFELVRFDDIINVVVND
jgi:hypothetical protein